MEGFRTMFFGFIPIIYSCFGVYTLFSYSCFFVSCREHKKDEERPRAHQSNNADTRSPPPKYATGKIAYLIVLICRRLT